MSEELLAAIELLPEFYTRATFLIDLYSTH